MDIIQLRNVSGGTGHADIPSSAPRLGSPRARWWSSSPMRASG